MTRIRFTALIASAVLALTAFVLPAVPATAAPPTMTTWFVPDAAVQVATTVPARAFVVPMAYSPGSYTTYSGTWTVASNLAFSHFRGGGYYGYHNARLNKSITLGRMTLDYSVGLANTQIRVYPFYSQSTRGTRNTTLTAQILYLSASYPNGAAASVMRSSPCGGRASHMLCAYYGTYVNYQPSIHKAVFVGQARWNDPTFSGTWHFWAKSAEFWRSTYRARGWRYYYAPIRTVPLRAGAGWQP